MLNSLQIRNLAVIDLTEVELQGSMTALTGETGAGKSILVDALGLSLGNRADSSAVRQGAQRAEISASFSISAKPELGRWLSEKDLDAEGEECLLRRVITAEGRSRAYINGHSVTLQVLRDLGEKLVDVCGQQAHQSLLRPTVQRSIVDHHGKHEKILYSATQAYDAWREAAITLEELENSVIERDANIELLRFQVRELETLNLAAGETAELEAKRQRLANSHQIANGLNLALAALSDAEAQTADTLLASAGREISSLAQIDSELQEPADLIEQAQIQTSEAVSEIRRQLDRMESDPGELQKLEDRLASLKDLARKHRVDADELPLVQQRLQTQLDELENAGERLDQRRIQVNQLEGDMVKKMSRLTRARKAAARKLSEAVERCMAELGMEGGRFQVHVDSSDPGPFGADRLEFRVSTNPGMAPGPVSRVASGGELSRIALAIQVIAAEGSHVPTLVFDEVDSGVGGGTAEVVGRLLAQLGQHHQVLCVTHLPQVASQADHHLFVTKESEQDETRTRIETLDHPERVEEIARMLGGVKITRRTREHAEEMLG